MSSERLKRELDSNVMGESDLHPEKRFDRRSSTLLKMKIN
jgi:hypothetical protein